jgi:hypothetical protein
MTESLRPVDIFNESCAPAGWGILKIIQPVMIRIRNTVKSEFLLIIQQVCYKIKQCPFIPSIIHFWRYALSVKPIVLPVPSVSQERCHNFAAL